MDMIVRCAWAKNEFSIPYHDTEWGMPVHDDRLLFEFLVLEGAQAGLSWDTILRKRARYREAFDNFDPAVVARYGKRKVNALPRDPVRREGTSCRRTVASSGDRIMAVGRCW